MVLNHIINTINYDIAQELKILPAGNLKISGAFKNSGYLKEISVIDFDHNDVVRHPLVSKIVRAYEDKNND